MISGQKTTMLELKPKSPKYAAQFPSIVLWLDEQSGFLSGAAQRSQRRLSDREIYEYQDERGVLS